LRRGRLRGPGDARGTGVGCRIAERQRCAPRGRFASLPELETAMKKLVLETTAPFQGLPELVADKEGLFAKEGLTIEWVERDSDDKSTKVDVNSPKGLD